MFLVPLSRETRDLARGFDRLFDDAFPGLFGAPSARTDGDTPRSPALDVSETDKAYSVRIDVPGVKKEDVKVSIDGRRVSVEAKTGSTEEKKEGDRVVYRERSMSSYARSFTLPAEVDSVASTARLENGVLMLELPKRGAPAASQIKIN